MGIQIGCIGYVERGTEVKMALLVCQYASTALHSCDLTSSIYKHVASVIEAVGNDKTERPIIVEQVGGIGEVEKGTEE